ncbi:MEDS domain-containing protein [Evansella cellulosilytica]|uniref:histidine kinase n=1 Tax=Evansella cellulosilytica (strain ATCC 21833 / DSM 2522 / FERM P-1141 / JCM 9156 / N-4) TaxID=649639 RepID=E6TXN0_EVAC2|nr:ATP-binding protein [Evansella cellulosilytica]ADU28844.1 histidine kinase [Evansella cellulosilytica DSM 2522]
MLVLPINKITSSQTVKSSGAHILYMYNEYKKYVQNLVSFIHEGLIENEIILIVEYKNTINLSKKELEKKGLTNAQIENIKWVFANEFYINENQFDANGAGKKLIHLLQPFIDQGYNIRTWGQVPIINQDAILDQLNGYECHCDDFTSKRKTKSVCAYNAITTPSFMQNVLLKTHTYFMTDDDYNLSPFYNRKHSKTASVEEVDRLRRMEEQNKDLLDRNTHLIFENNLVKLNNEVIKQNESKLRTVINELPIPIIIRNNKYIIFYNSEAEAQFSIDNQHVVAENLLSSFFENYARNIKHQHEVQEQMFILKNEKKKYYLVKSINISFEGEPAVLHSFVDVTKEKENENLMIRSEKMNIAGELAASIAHELRNPLTAIKGFFKMLRDTEKYKERYFQIIEDELSRIEQISSELLTLAKPHTEKRQDQNIVNLIEEVKFLLSSQSNMKCIEVILEVSSNELYVNCEVTKIKQVFINLVKNAIEAMQEGGNIKIKVERIGNIIQAKVIDHGSGIPEELLSKIGEPFYTTKEKGTGIGLMVCYQIIESHGGTIHFDSKVNIGTTFTITLPALVKSLSTQSQ